MDQARKADAFNCGWYSFVYVQDQVLTYYLPEDFGGDKKPEVGPWKSKNFLLGGDQESSNPPPF